MILPNEIEDKEQIKHLLFYQVETIKDDYENLEERHQKLNLEFKDKHRVNYNLIIILVVNFNFNDFNH